MSILCVYYSITGNVKGSRRRSHAPTLLSVDEQGVTFRSYRDGQKVTLTPGVLVQKYSLTGTKVLANWYKRTNTDAKTHLESTVQHQKKLGADIIIPLDELPPYRVEKTRLRQSLLLSHRWEACVLSLLAVPVQKYRY